MQEQTVDLSFAKPVAKSLPYMFNGAIAMFEHRGFARSRRLGTNHCVVAKVVQAVPDPAGG